MVVLVSFVAAVDAGRLVFVCLLPCECGDDDDVEVEECIARPGGRTPQLVRHIPACFVCAAATGDFPLSTLPIVSPVQSPVCK